MNLSEKEGVGMGPLCEVWFPGALPMDSGMNFKKVQNFYKRTIPSSSTPLHPYLILPFPFINP